MKKILLSIIFVLCSFSFCLAEEDCAVGNVSSPIRIYVFSDWYCLPCLQMDNRLSFWFGDVKGIASIEFIDKIKSAASEKFTGFNISAQLNHGEDYLKIRKLLKDYALKNENPSTNDIDIFLKNNGINLKMAGFGKMSTIIKKHQTIIEEYKIKATPSIVIVNKKTGKSMTAIGYKNINKAWIDTTISALTAF